MRRQIRAEERKALDDLLGAVRRQARQAKRDAVRGATGLHETVAGGSRPPARHALGDAARSLSHRCQSGTSACDRSESEKCPAEACLRIVLAPPEPAQHVNL